MLDLSRASNHQLELDCAPVDVVNDVLNPVAAMFYNRDDMFEVIVEQLISNADRLRLKQAVVILGRNAVKFVVDTKDSFAYTLKRRTAAFISASRIQAPEFQRRSESVSSPSSGRVLDVLSQGTGIGVSFCERLVELMGGSVRLDESYHSGMANKPGARFIVDLNVPPIAVESVMMEDRKSTRLNSSHVD